MKEYKRYPNSELLEPRNWHILVKKPREEIISLRASWVDIKAENKVNWESNEKQRAGLIKELGDLFKKYDMPYELPASLQTKKKKHQPFFEKTLDYIKSYRNYIPYSFPYAHMGEQTIDGVNVCIGKSPTDIIELYDSLVYQISQGKKQMKNGENHLIECIKQAAIHNIDISNLDKAKIIDKVEDFLKKKYQEDNFPEGKTIDIDDNYCECSTYFIGDRRCSCGDRRIYVYIDGNCMDGYRLVAEAY